MQKERAAAQGYLDQHLASIPAEVGIHGAAFGLRQTSGAAPQHGVMDFARLAMDARVAAEFNPFLSAASVHKLQQGARVWLQLCVLEDRLRRLARLVEDPASSPAEIMQVR